MVKRLAFKGEGDLRVCLVSNDATLKTHELYYLVSNDATLKCPLIIHSF